MLFVAEIDLRWCIVDCVRQISYILVERSL